MSSFKERYQNQVSTKKIEVTNIIDLSQIAHSTYFAQVSSNDGADEFEIFAMWKHFMLNSIRKNIVLHKPDEVIIAVDSKSWRKKAFKYYKAKREQIREESGIDFEQFFNTLNEFIDELEQNFPYKIIRYNGCEADDIIAILVTELADKRKKIVITSGDKDFKQLLTAKHIKLFDNVSDTFLECQDIQEFKLYHTIKGDKSDGIPNIMNPDDAFIVENYVYSKTFITWMNKQPEIKELPSKVKDVEAFGNEQLELLNEMELRYKKSTGKEAKIKERQVSCGDNKIAEIMMMGVDEFIEKNPELKPHYERNKKLIILDRVNIAENLWKGTLATYEALPNKKSDFSKISAYLGAKKMKLLLSVVSEFII